MDANHPPRSPPTPRTTRRRLSSITSAIELKTVRVENAKQALKEATRIKEVMPKHIQKVEKDMERLVKEQDKMIDILMEAGELGKEEV
jgi:exonuclease VII small subunit